MDARLPLDLWIWSLTEPCPPARAALLTASEEARAARFVNPDHGLAYRMGRGRLREILGDLTGQDPRHLDLRTGPHGKPFLPDGPSFNLSHSGGCAALVVSDTSVKLGIDIEAFRPVEPGVAARFFTASENAALEALPPDLWAASFFRCWTRKEAIVKAVGDGLTIPLDAFDVTLAPDAPARLLQMDPDLGRAQDWTLHHLDLSPTLVGAIALRSAARLDITIREGAFPL